MNENINKFEDNELIENNEYDKNINEFKNDEIDSITFFDKLMNVKNKSIDINSIANSKKSQLTQFEIMIVLKYLDTYHDCINLFKTTSKYLVNELFQYNPIQIFNNNLYESYILTKNLFPNIYEFHVYFKIDDIIKLDTTFYPKIIYWPYIIYNDYTKTKIYENDNIIIKNIVLDKIPEDDENENFICNNSINIIVKKAGAYNWKLKSIDLSNNILQIPLECFESCHNLTKINIPSSVTYIDSWAFSKCENLSEIKLPEYLEIIDSYAFDYCEKLNEIIIPNTVHIINEACFYKCRSLTKIKLSNRLNRIMENCFFGCSSLKDIDIPKNIKMIEQEAFRDCFNLESVNLEKDRNEKLIIDRFCFTNCLKLVNIDFNKCCIHRLTFRSSSGNKKHKYENVNYPYKYYD